MEANAIDLAIYLFGISILILIIVLYLIWTDPQKDEILVDNPNEIDENETKKAKSKSKNIDVINTKKEI